MRFIFSLLAFISLGLPQAMATTPCKGWLSNAFWNTATLIDVRNCLATSSATAGDKYDRTPLHFAARYSTDPAIVTALSSAGADVNAHDKHEATPLVVAARYSTSPAIITAFVVAGADVNAVTRGGETPLHLAAGGSTTPAIITALVAAGADVTARDDIGATPLILAAKYSKTEAVLMELLKAGSDASSTTNDEKRAIDYAEENKALVGSKAYQRLKDASNGN